MELREKRAKIGLGVSGVGLGAGLVLTIGGFVSWAKTPLGGESGAAEAAIVAGVTVMAIGAVAMLASGVMLRKRQRKLHELKQAHDGTPRRVQWDLARSRLVF
jgi:hypothetical protein